MNQAVTDRRALSRRRLATTAAALACVLLVGCAVLPAAVARAPSRALTDAGTTPITRLADDSTPDDRRLLSGFALLPDGADSLATRLALARRARSSLDVQYYLIESDDAGREFLRTLRSAADRGVRVRLLVDDLHAAAQDEVLAALAASANVEVRLFNPLPARTGTPMQRVVLSMHAFGRINGRMHNKLFIADNRLAVAGGRNIGDEYFMRGQSANFIDMDVLASGPVVPELAEVFDRFWNSELAYPIGGLLAVPRDPAVFDRLAAPAPSARKPGAAAPASVAAQIERGRLELQFAPARVLADAPDKAADPDGHDHPGEAMHEALELMQSAQSEVLIASPYFVPGPQGIELMRAAIDKGVRITVLTNSLGATDEPLAYWGYARYRREMLAMGVNLAELSPLPAQEEPPRVFASSSLARLHAKVAVLDRRWLLVGSMNMDKRSSRINTEMALAIDSPALADAAAATLQHDWLPGNYRLRLAHAGRGIEWLATENERTVVHRAEPGVGWMLRFRLGLMSMWVSEEML